MLKNVRFVFSSALELVLHARAELKETDKVADTFLGIT